MILWNTGVSETGCVILLRFLPRLLKPAGLLKHPEMGNALVRIHDRIGFERGLQVDGELVYSKITCVIKAGTCLGERVSFVEFVEAPVCEKDVENVGSFQALKLVPLQILENTLLQKQ